MRRNMQTHHPSNYQLNHHSLNHPLNSSLINSFNHGHQNYSINTSQQLNQHSSPIIFHHPTTQQQSSNPQATPTQQRQPTVLHSNGLLELVDNSLQNLNQLNQQQTRFNQRNQLHGHSSNEHCNSQHCLSNYCINNQSTNSQANAVLVNQLNNQLNQLNQLNNSLNGNTNSINQNHQNHQNNYQRLNSQQQNSPRLSPSRHRYNRTRWPRFLNNNYQTNLHSNNVSNNHPIIHTNRPNTLVYSPTIQQSPLSPLINNLTPSNNNNLFPNQQQPNASNLFTATNNLDTIYPTNENCSNSNSLNNLVNLTNLANSNLGNLNNLNNVQSGTNQYHPRRFNNNLNSNNVQSRSSRQRSSNLNSNNLNAFNLLNAPFVNIYPNLVQMNNSNLHSNAQHHSPGASNNYFVANRDNILNNNRQQIINLIACALDSNLQNNLQIFNPILYHNLNLFNNFQNVDLMNRTINQMNNNVPNANGNHYQLPQHYSNQYFHHNNSSNQNQTSNSNSNSNSLTNALQSDNYDALMVLAHRLGENKTRGLTKSQIDRLPSYKYKYSLPSSHKTKSLKSTSSLKQQQNSSKRTNKSTSNLTKLCKHNSHLNNSEEEDLLEELDELDSDKLKDDKLNSKRTKCIGKLNDDELEEYCESFICDNEQVDEDEKVICVICMCDFEIKQVLRILPCSHEFHARCIDKWLKVSD